MSIRYIFREALVVIEFNGDRLGNTYNSFKFVSDKFFIS